ncbi:aconitate hydratase [Palleronia aestuarii]|uniref:aconitate hydratase n=1 Tax=Palleronia aestuarii TaxID=568105 RepID=A0A2W7NB25_9RHOB|nr:aconitate hydratase AcnA [Palleronia aestuarii]PZX17190.1 aconitate hydratase [Palleronia aestuarii]
MPSEMAATMPGPGMVDETPIDLEAVLGQWAEALPLVLRLFAEDAAAHRDTEEGAASLERIRARIRNGARSGQGELALHPRRVLTHDTTASPALVDIAALRDAAIASGFDAALFSPKIPVDVIIDHSVSVDHHAQPDAVILNRRLEFRRHEERYGFLKWAGRALDRVTVVPPGRGILHTLNLEDLAQVASVDPANGRLRPDTMIGTDSHTPMAGALGMLAWGVGGLEAEMAMFGLPLLFAFPRSVGVRLEGVPAQGVTATDIALTVTERLRARGVTGAFVEFGGPGVAALSLGARAAIANMAPEYGARTGLFPVDDETLAYLRRSGRTTEHVARVERWARAQGFWHRPDARLDHDEEIEIDLGHIATSFAGPSRPDERKDAAGLKRWGRAARAGQGGLPRAAVVIAAITSCTNSADPALILSAGLVARRARRLGVTPPGWVKTSFAPGSAAAQGWLEAAGLSAPMAELGFGLSAIGCTTCIGNSGPLIPSAQAALETGAEAVAVLSGNRNFPHRIHAALEHAFLCSPPMVVILALAGRLDLDPTKDVLAIAPDGAEVRLDDLWPDPAEIATALAAIGHDRKAAGNDRDWNALQAPDTPLFPWDPGSTTLCAPPFLDRAGIGARLDLASLAVFGDGMTTDHISPDGSIPPESPAARWLAEGGVARPNAFASYRGNWNVMLRGAFSRRPSSSRNKSADPARRRGPSTSLRTRHGHDA